MRSSFYLIAVPGILLLLLAAFLEQNAILASPVERANCAGADGKLVFGNSRDLT